MEVTRKIRAALRRFVAEQLRAEVDRVVESKLSIVAQLVRFQASSPEDRQSFYDHTRDPLRHAHLYGALAQRLVTAGVPVEERDIDIGDFSRWLADFPEIHRYYQGLGDAFIEKCLEHYLAYRHLALVPGDIYIDVAAAGSPWSDMLAPRGFNAYSLDLVYSAGVHGRRIGADVAETRLPPGFATVLSAQCAFECLEGETDVGFLVEAARILKPAGRCGIVPLYLDDTSFITTSPYCEMNPLARDEKAKLVWRDDKYKVPFSRHYSPEHFYERIFTAMPATLRGKVLYFRNLPEVARHYAGQRIYCFFLFHCVKENTV